MPAPIACLHGTWGRSDTWFRPGYAFCEGLKSYGLSLIHDNRFFEWSGRIGGLPDWTPGDPKDHANDIDLEWANEAKHFVYFCSAHRPNEEISIIAHSHGGNVAAMAIAAYGLKVRHLITVSTPPREDMKDFYKETATSISGIWKHVYGDFWKDWWIKAGQFWDGSLGWNREIEEAYQNIYLEGNNHSSMLNDISTFYNEGLIHTLLR